MGNNLFSITVINGFSNKEEDLYCFTSLFMEDQNTGNCYKVESDYYIVANTEIDQHNNIKVTKIINSYRTESMALKAHPELSD